ncbi:MAG: crossover junction endodeoxyribonuclease RuvC [Minisyncoccia bacterium]
MKIISVDPGYERLGIAILEKENGKEVLIFSECFKTSAKLPHSERLHLIGKELGEVIEKYKPEALAIETLFFAKNQKSAMQVAEARGVIMYESKRNNLEIFEYSPMAVKIAVTGYGKSDKIQVTNMVKRLVKITKPIKHDDEYDAIAIGLTFFATQKR